jgi:hypothetical protein
VNFSADDRRRSLRRFLMAVLDSPPWMFLTEPVAIADERRPVGVIESVGSVATTRARATVPQGNVEKAQSYAISLYPPLPGEVASTEDPAVMVPVAPEVARLAADELAHLVDQAVTVGLVNDDGTSWSHPLRLPVWDYSATPVVGAGRAGPADLYGWMWVEDFGAEPLADPDDSRRWTVGLSLRLSWEQAGRDVAPAPIVVAGGLAGGFVVP